MSEALFVAWVVKVVDLFSGGIQVNSGDEHPSFVPNFAFVEFAVEFGLSLWCHVLFPKMKLGANCLLQYW